MARRSGGSSAGGSRSAVAAGFIGRLNEAVLAAVGYDETRTWALFSVEIFSFGSACKITMSSVEPLLSSMVRIVRRVISFLATITPTTLMKVIGWFL